MNLTLFPLTALLLLLSGMGTPAHAGGSPTCSSAMMKRLTGRQNAAISALKGAGSSQAATVRQHSGRNETHASLPAHDHARFPFGGSPLPAGLVRKQYRTRFGFADGAYLAVGPPRRVVALGHRCL